MLGQVAETGANNMRLKAHGSRDALKLGLAESAINYMLQGPQVTLPPKVTTNCAKELQTAGDGSITQKEIENEDVCPICQDVLFRKMLPVTYCRFGCGNNVHIVCMKIWADHQEGLKKDSLVKCPLCREDFATLKLILEEFRNCKRLVTVAERQRLDRHLGIPCNNCRVYPIEGNCYKCTECPEYHLCNGCFRSFCHPSHTFASREKRNQEWRSVEHLLRLSTLEENLKHINPGENCHEEKDQVKKCIDHWLRKKNGCPIDGHVVYNPLTWQDVPSKVKENPFASEVKNKLAEQAEQELFIPGTGLFIQGTKPGYGSEKCEMRCKGPSEFEQDLTLNGFSYGHMRSSGSGQPNIRKTGNLKFSRHVRGLALFPRARSDMKLGTHAQNRSVNTCLYFKSLSS
ncbi:UNVERIFIED_CONTAM: hypothetical protein K2H54_046508 [Gekko kuhli]